MRQAREQLIDQDARETFFSFYESLVDVTKHKSTEPRLKRAAVRALRDVSASIGVGRDVVAIPSRDDREIDNWQPAQLQDHIAERVSAGTFLFEVTRDRMMKDEGALKVGGSDVSQHWDIVHLPTADGLLPIRIAFPVVLHNAAVVIKLGTQHHERNQNQPWVTYFVPQLVQDAREWMVIDSATLYELDENLQKRLCLTSMDVGQYYIEHDQMMMGDFVPNVHFRDGRIFPNDCYGFNASQDSVQGKFVRKAIKRMDSFLGEAQKQKTMVCGVAKTTSTGCFGPVVDWYIRDRVESDWPFEDPRPADTVWMTHLLSDDAFDGTFNKTLASCGVTRTFRDASDLRTTETSGEILKEKEERLLLELARHDFADTFKRALDTKVAMFFLGHSRRPDIRLPRYEYHTNGQGSHAEQVARVLAALKFVGLVADEDHDYLARETLRTLVPSVILYSHDHSKAVGDRLVLDVKQKIIEALRPLGAGD
jgi:hypothetical protein